MKPNSIKIRILKALLFIAAGSVITIFNACKSSPISSEENPSVLQITEGPEDGDTVRNDYVRFGWIGRGASDFVYSFRLLVYNENDVPEVLYPWSEYNTQIRTTFQDLDDQKYRFELRAQVSEVDPGTETREFHVLAVIGPTVILYRKNTEVEVGEECEIDIKIIDITDFKAMSVILIFDGSLIYFNGAESGDLVIDSRMTQIITPDYNNADKLAWANDNEIIELNTILLKNLNSPDYLDKNGSVIKMKFVGMQTGEAEITFARAEVRDHYNAIVELPTYLNSAKVTVIP